MSDATDRLRGHVASYKYSSPHRENCIDVCDEVDRLTAALQRIARREVPDATSHGQVLVAREALAAVDKGDT